MKLHLNARKILMATVFVAISAIIHAMPVPASGPTAGGPPGGSPPVASPPAGGPPCWSPPCVPVDGGIGILLAAGAIIGARKIYRSTRRA